MIQHGLGCWMSVKNLIPICLHSLNSVENIFVINLSSWLFFFGTQGAAAAIGAGNKVKNLLNQEVRQVKRRRRRLKISGKTLVGILELAILFDFFLFSPQQQIEERNIELEGTRAQLRVMESKLASSRSDSSPDHQSSNVNSRLSSHDGITIMHTSTPNRIPHSQNISTPSMKAMIPLTMDEEFKHSSSTESAHDQQEREAAMAKCPETPKRSKPSKIPLPGMKGFVAKPPSGRPPVTGPPSNKSLTKSTSSLYNGQKSIGPSSITKKDTSLTRPDSVQSWRNMSFDGKSSSIPISKKPSVLSVSSSPNANNSPPTNINAYTGSTIVNIPSSKYVASSPLPRHKRDTLTTKVKNLDSLSRHQSSSTGALSTSCGGMNVTRSPTFSNAVTNGTSNRKNTALPVRRMSNVSVGRENDVHDSANESNGGKVRNFRFWNWLKA